MILCRPPPRFLCTLRSIDANGLVACKRRKQVSRVSPASLRAAVTVALAEPEGTVVPEPPEGAAAMVARVERAAMVALVDKPANPDKPVNRERRENRSAAQRILS